jgi:hypothetical protein
MTLCELSAIDFMYIDAHLETTISTLGVSFLSCAANTIDYICTACSKQANVNTKRAHEVTTLFSSCTTTVSKDLPHHITCKFVVVYHEKTQKQ